MTQHSQNNLYGVSLWTKLASSGTRCSLPKALAQRPRSDREAETCVGVEGVQRIRMPPWKPRISVRDRKMVSNVQSVSSPHPVRAPDSRAVSHLWDSR